MPASTTSQPSSGSSSGSSSGCADLLLLFLGLNENLRVPPNAWDFLTLKDLSSTFVVSKEIRSKLERIEYTSCRDGCDYLVKFPGYPGLFQKCSTGYDGEGCGGLFRHQLATLQTMHRLENTHRDYGALRGGILGDAPGLGKTVSVLALISSTAAFRPVPPLEFWGSVKEGWEQLRNNQEAASTLLQALKPVRTWVQANARSLNERSVSDFHKMQRYIIPPYRDGRLSTITEFELYVTRSLKHFVPRFVLEIFRQNLLNVKAGLDKRNRKIIKSPIGRRLAWERQLISSSATLIIVPDALLEHWYQQIKKHLLLPVYAEHDTQTSYTTNKSKQIITPGVVYLDGIGDMSEVKSLHNVSLSSQASSNFPPSYELSKYLIVITTFSRCKVEYQREVASGRISHSRKRPRSQAVESDSKSNSSLLQLRWLRMVVDEGHELGTHKVGNGTTRFIHLIAAERRWVLSGTPTTGDEDDVQYTASALDQLQRLLMFLRHPIYGVIAAEMNLKTNYTVQPENDQNESIAKTAWVERIKEPFQKRQMRGRNELMRVLREIMIMHRKEDLQLPMPIFRQVEAHADIPKDVEDKMLTLKTPFKKSLHLDQYLHSPEFQSLVDQTQADYIVKAIQKARTQSLEWGEQQRQASTPDTTTTIQSMTEFQNTTTQKDLRPIKAIVYSSEKNNLLSVTEVLIRLLGHEHVAEMYEIPNSIGEISAELARFRTNTKEFRTCPVCQRENDLRFQGRTGDRCNLQLLEVVSTVDGTRFLIEPERITRTLNVPSHRLNGRSMSIYHRHPKFWKVDDLLQVDVRDPHPFLPKRESEASWLSMGAEKCCKLAVKDQFMGQDWYFGNLPATEENSLVVVRLAKWQECGRFHNSSRWYKGKRLADAPIDTIQEQVFLLSLDAGLSHGLDLSFVTHMFLLEPIDDAALLEQVTSRAHRLGATGPVHVETINVLYKLSQDLDAIMKTAKTNTSLTSFNQDQEKSLSKIVCQHCYRQFDSFEKAEEHERKLCPRNSSSKIEVDQFHLSSVYREIRPPLPMSASQNKQD